MSTGQIARSMGLLAVVVGLAAGRASADPAELVKRIPAGANAIAFIDVESLLNSKLGKSEGWRAKLADAYASKPLTVPPGAKQVLMASWIEPNGMDPMWEVSLIELSKSASMERIAKDEKGFVESFGDKLAAWTPMNAYFVRLDAKLLGVVSPSDRQFASRWAANNGGAATSPYLLSAVNKIEPNTGYVFALDLGDVVSEKRCRARLAMDEFACMAGKDINVNKVSGVIASVKGLKLSVQVDDDISGVCTVEFGKPVSDLGEYAKPLLLEMLDRSGAGISDFNDWKATVKGNDVLLSGKLSADGFRRLISIVDPPSPGQTDESAAPDKSTSQAPTAEASQKYFKSVSAIIDGAGKQVRGATSLNKGGTYIARDARRIDRLPILNVDPDLVQWGTSVSAGLIQVASALGVGGYTARSATANVSEASVNTGYNYANYYNYGQMQTDPNDEVNRRNANRQRIAASADVRANVLTQVSGILQGIETSRANIRAAMTQKLKVEF